MERPLTYLLLDSARTRTLPTVPMEPVREPTPAERVWAALHYIERNPRDWNQKTWQRCLAGWAVRQSGRNVIWMSSDEICRDFRRMTGLGVWRTANIALSVNSLRRLRRLTRRYFGPDPYAADKR